MSALVVCSALVGLPVFGFCFSFGGVGSALVAVVSFGYVSALLSLFSFVFCCWLLSALDYVCVRLCLFVQLLKRGSFLIHGEITHMQDLFAQQFSTKQLHVALHLCFLLYLFCMTQV